MDMKNNAVFAVLAFAAFGVAAAAVVVMKKGKAPTPDRVLDECLRAADELEMRVRSSVSEFAT
jgi:hypothetical protein